MCHSTQSGYKIYEAAPKKPFRVIYSTETELHRKYYGEPETASFFCEAVDLGGLGIFLPPPQDLG